MLYYRYGGIRNYTKLEKVLYMLYLYHRLECLHDIYACALGPAALRLVRIYQAKHECLWYKCYAPRCPCRLIARQNEVETRIYYIDRLGKFDYGPAHASRNHRYPNSG